MASLRLSSPAVYTDGEGTEWIELRQLHEIAGIDHYRWENTLVQYLVLSDEVQKSGCITLFRTFPDQNSFRTIHPLVELIAHPDAIYGTPEGMVLVKKELGKVIQIALESQVVRFLEVKTSTEVPVWAWNATELEPDGVIRRFKCLAGYDKKDKVVACPYGEEIQQRFKA